MAKRHKVRQSLLSVILLWIGRRLITRVQRKTITSVTKRAGKLGKAASSPAVQNAAANLVRDAAAKITKQPSVAPRRRAGRGIALTVMSAAAVAALKYGVGKVVEAERNEHVVTPDFDVFNDDEN